MAASVSTRVVSWKDAAEMNESVESDAFVMPSRTGLPCFCSAEPVAVPVGAQFRARLRTCGRPYARMFASL
jgi:hypothetical protein